MMCGESACIMDLHLLPQHRLSVTPPNWCPDENWCRTLEAIFVLLSRCQEPSTQDHSARRLGLDDFHRTATMASLDDTADNDSAKVSVQPTAPRPHGFQFQCDLCQEECFGVPLIINSKHGYVVDAECAAEAVVPKILEAKASEYSYPPTWGRVVISHRQFLHLLPAGFEGEYRKRRREYHTPLADRIYCRRARQKDHGGLTEQCGTFLGKRLSSPDELCSNGTTAKSCSDCDDPSFASCMRCGQTVAINSTTEDVTSSHHCQEAAHDDAAAFQGLVQGVHYQICPGCNMKVELAEACNALICRGYACRTSFCAICGQPATYDSDHWQVGKPCPRWNRPSDSDAGYDPEPEIVDEDLHRQRDWDTAHHFWHDETNHWRQRSWNQALARDEAYVLQLLDEFNQSTEGRMSEVNVPDLEKFNAELENALLPGMVNLESFEDWLETARLRLEAFRNDPGHDLNVTLFRMFLILGRDTLRLIPLYRGIGLQLTTHHMEHLMSCCMLKLASLLVVRHSIEESLISRFPRLMSLLSRTVRQLEALIDEISALLEVHETVEMEPPIHQDPENPMAGHLVAYRDMVEFHKSRVSQSFPRSEELDAAMGMFWLQYVNLTIPLRYQEARSFDEKYGLVARFGVQHHQIQQQRRVIEQFVWPDGLLEEKRDFWWRMLMEYDSAAAQFTEVYSPTILEYHQHEFGH